MDEVESTEIRNRHRVRQSIVKDLQPEAGSEKCTVKQLIILLKLRRDFDTEVIESNHAKMGWDCPTTRLDASGRDSTHHLVKFP